MSSTPQESATKDPVTNNNPPARSPSSRSTSGADAIEGKGIDLEALLELAEQLDDLVFGDPGGEIGHAENLRLDYRPPKDRDVIRVEDGEKLLQCAFTKRKFSSRYGEAPVLVCDPYDYNGDHQGLRSHVVCWELAQDRAALLERYADYLHLELKTAAVGLYGPLKELQALQAAEEIRTGSIHETGHIAWKR